MTTANPSAEDSVNDQVVQGEVVTAEVVDHDALPEDPAAAKEVLIGMLADERRVADDVLNDLQRVAAEFDNYRKRVQRDQSEIIDRAAERVVLELLPVLDSFDSAFTHEAQSPSEEKLVAGMRSTYEQLLSILVREGLSPIVAVGEPFDPTVHEAAQAPADAGPQLVVTEELRRGYMLGERLIRPALVVVDHA